MSFSCSDEHAACKLHVASCTARRVALCALHLTSGKRRAASDRYDEYVATLQHNDRAILEEEAGDGGFVRVLCRKGTDEIVGATVCANRAGESARLRQVRSHTRKVTTGGVSTRALLR